MISLIIALAAQVFAPTDPTFWPNVNVSTAHVVVTPTIGSSTSNFSSSATSLTITNYIVSGANPAVLVFTAGASSLTTRSVNTLTFNGGANATNNQVFTTNFTGHGNAYIYFVVNPPSGDIVVTYSGANNSGMHIAAMTVNGTTTTGATAGSFASATRTAVSETLPSLTTDLVISYVAGAVTGGNPWAAGAGMATNIVVVGGANAVVGSTNGFAANTTVSWSGTALTVTDEAVVVHGL